MCFKIQIDIENNEKILNLLLVQSRKLDLLMSLVPDNVLLLLWIDPHQNDRGINKRSSSSNCPSQECNLRCCRKRHTKLCLIDMQMFCPISQHSLEKILKFTFHVNGKLNDQSSINLLNTLNIGRVAGIIFHKLG